MKSPSPEFPRRGLAAIVAGAVAAVAWVFVAGPQLRADNQEELAGPIVQIGPDDEGPVEGQPLATPPEEPQDRPPQDEVAEPQFWIGIQGRTIDSPVLRTHLQLAEDLGIVIEQVVPDSPADQAGLREHDIVIRAGGQPVQNMLGLQQIVHDSGSEPIQLGVIRLAKEIDIEVTPATMPAEIRRRAEELERFGLPEGGFPRGLDDLLGGPLGQLRGLEQEFGGLPGGLSVKITRDEQGRPRITVRQGDKTWELDAENDDALQQLPEALRPLIERLLDGRDRSDRRFELRDFDRRLDLRDLPGRFAPDVLEPFSGPRRRDQGEEDEVLERMEQLERRLEELQERLEEEDRP